MKSFLFSILSITVSFAVATPSITTSDAGSDGGDSSSASSEDFSRIVGGEDIDPGDYPYLVFFPIGCGGALIAPDLVLTAAHCGNRQDDQVHIGAYEALKLTGGSQERFCDTWIGHPSYNIANFLDFDFALCKLNEPVIIDESRIRLELNEDDAVPSGGEDLIAIGLGALASGGAFPSITQEVTVAEVNNTFCNQVDDTLFFEPGNGLYFGVINENKLCAGIPGVGEKDACQGDSGGPLIRRTTNSDGLIEDEHVGIVSYGIGCAEPDFPGVYARTSAGSSWIKDTACNELQSIASFCGENTIVPPLPCTGPELTYTVATDSNPLGVSTKLKTSESTIFRRSYVISDYVNVHKVCLEPDTDYTWRIKGGGFCPDDGLCGWFSLSLDGEVIFGGSGRDYEFSLPFRFRTPAEPTADSTKKSKSTKSSKSSKKEKTGKSK